MKTLVVHGNTTSTGFNLKRNVGDTGGSYDDYDVIAQVLRRREHSYFTWGVSSWGKDKFK